MEHSLTPGERSRYESHLAACHPCRSTVIALTRLSEADPDYSLAGAAPALARGKRAGGVGAWLVGWFAPPGFRQLVPAAVAFLVVAVSLPLMLLRKDSPTEQPPPRAEAAADQGQAVNDPRRSGPELGLSAKLDDRAAAARAETPGRPESDDSTRPEAAPSQTAPDEAKKEAIGAAAPDQPAPSAPPTERVDATIIAAEASRNVADGVQLPPAPSEPAPTPETEGTKLARIDETNSLRVPGDSKGSAEMIVVKPGVYSGRQSSGRITNGTITPRDGIAPPSSSSSDQMRRRIASPNPEAESRSRNSSESPRPRGTAARKINNKTFWLVKGVWTDKNYNSEREQAEITVVRDSDIYNDLMAKHSGLKAFFTAFPSDERVTVVYKDTVYKLVPRAK
ncbi:MAG TPA: hypothetical protein VE262_10865 [Blastocatellia bacterium]|nr:hypothetical protein [Blastocatellia bacterium]